MPSGPNSRSRAKSSVEPPLASATMADEQVRRRTAVLEPRSRVGRQRQPEDRADPVRALLDLLEDLSDPRRGSGRPRAVRTSSTATAGRSRRPGADPRRWAAGPRTARPPSGPGSRSAPPRRRCRPAHRPRSWSPTAPRGRPRRRSLASSARRRGIRRARSRCSARWSSCRRPAARSRPVRPHRSRGPPERPCATRRSASRRVGPELPGRYRSTARPGPRDSRNRGRTPARAQLHLPGRRA